MHPAACAQLGLTKYVHGHHIPSRIITPPAFHILPAEMEQNGRKWISVEQQSLQALGSN